MNFSTLEAFFLGIPTGFIFSFALGPVFFTLIQNSIENGFRSAVFVAVGVIFADICLLFLAYSGVQAFLPQGVDIAFWVRIFGGLLLIALGIASFLKKVKTDIGIDASQKHYFWRYWAQGFFINLLNPANFAEWIGAAGYTKTVLYYNNIQNILFFSGALLAVFLTEIGVAFFAEKLRKVLTVSVMQCVNWVSGGLFCVFGLVLLGSAFLQ